MSSILSKVNILQGTESSVHFSNGNSLPLVSVPFGMNAWCPQTTTGHETWFYHPSHRHFYGLRLTHQPSPWIGDYGHLSLLPQTGKAMLTERYSSSSFLPEDMTLEPNYMRVQLLRYRVSLELAPTSRAAAIRMAFTERREPRLKLSLFPGQSYIRLSPEERTISGYTRACTGGVPENFALYFSIKLDCDIDAASSTLYFKDNDAVENTLDKHDVAGAFIYLQLPESGIVRATIGTSYISVEQAALNAQREIHNRSLDEIKNTATALWEDHLGRIRIESKEERKVNTFYSCLYRCCLFPREMHEFDEMERKVHFSPHNGHIEHGSMYTDVGFWDSYRTVWPLQQLLFPTRASDILQGWVNVYKESGWMPKWVSPGERSAMPGTLIDMTFADAIAKGLGGFDIETAYKGLLNHAMNSPDGTMYGRIGLEAYKQYGYLPHDLFHESVSNALDYYYGDFCISTIATLLGDEENARILLGRSQNYRYLFDTDSGFMRGRLADGSWQSPFDPIDWGDPFCEGGAWQCSWAVQHDLLGLAEAMGGVDALINKINELMITHSNFNIGSYPAEIHEMSEMAAAGLGQFAISNQPSFHIPYIYAALGQPNKTRKWVRRTLEGSFSSNPDGFPGDEDNGSTAAWFVLGSLGIYPLTPGIPEYVLGCPLFDKAEIDLENGNTITIKVAGAGVEYWDVRQIYRDGSVHKPLFITHEDFISGRELLFETRSNVCGPDDIVLIEHLPFSLSAHADRLKRRNAEDSIR